MTRSRKKIEAMLNAITFAESGDHATAREFLANQTNTAQKASKSLEGRKSALSGALEQTIDVQMPAAALAEEGLYDEAERLMHFTSFKTVLLVIEGESPKEAAFNHAKKLCERTNAQLDILQIITPTRNTESLEILSQRMSRAITNLVQLLQKGDIQTAMPKLTIRLGEIDSKLLNYVRRHKEVSAIVLDPSVGMSKETDSSIQKEILKKLSRKLSVPLMTVLDRPSIEAPA